MLDLRVRDQAIWILVARRNKEGDYSVLCLRGLEVKGMGIGLNTPLFVRRV